jgi:hypothetical protein
VYHRRLFILKKKTRTYTLADTRSPWSAADRFLRSQFDVQGQLRVLPVDEVIRRAVDFGVDLRSLAFDNYSNCLTIHTASDAAELVADLDCLGGCHRELAPAFHAQLLPRVFCRPYAELQFRKQPVRRPPAAVLPRRRLVLLSMLSEGTGGGVPATLEKLSYLGPLSGHSRVLPRLVDVMECRGNPSTSLKTYRAWVTKLQHGFFRKMRAKNSVDPVGQDTKRKKKTAVA